MHTARMKCSVLLLLVLMALSSASPVDDRKHAEDGKVVIANQGVTNQLLLNVAKFNRTQAQPQPSSMASVGQSNLKWETFNDDLPDNAVSFINDYEKRLDYICKYNCDAGFYNPSNGPYCYYASGNTENAGSPFEVLVNRDNFETLVWKDGSYGSVPYNAVRTCPGAGIYVGKNEYGLGKVSTEDKKFSLPWKKSEYDYDTYQVLAINNDNIVGQQIDDVKYTNAQIHYFPPEIMRNTTINNYECRTVTKTDTVSKTHEVQKSWSFDFTLRIGVQTSFKAGVPFLASNSIQVSGEVTFDFTKTSTVTDTITDNVSIVFTAPANHSCSISMLFYKYSAQIPFTARLSRTYGNGDVKTTDITGTFDSFETSDIKTVVDRCTPLSDNRPCV